MNAGRTSTILSDVIIDLNYTALTFQGQEESLPLVLKATLTILLVFVIVIGCVGNLIVCLIVYKNPAMRSAINILLANMALTDIFLSAVCMPPKILMLFSEDKIIDTVPCQIFAFLQETFVSTGILTLLTISMDRYRIIVKRRDKLTTAHAKILTVLSWGLSILLTFPPLIGWGKYKFYPRHSQCIYGIHSSNFELIYLILKICFINFFPIIAMGFSYFGIIHKVRRDALRIRNCPELDSHVSVTISNGKLGLPIIHRKKNSHIDIHFKTRSFKTILILFIALTICWTPYGINLMISNITGSYECVRSTILIWIGFVKCAVNPIIYFIYISKFREACEEYIPTSFKFSMKIRVFNKRRINPAAIYLYKDKAGTEGNK
ncbi:high-affinity lysophosphatidic acid receptor-like [Saccostrea echinata]|uniref:high-affinity lysophosphatidic acid receptor-like n=1 Tax=Saccostrea echinata TaxID=191078 RepID=UPI002A838B19|nr:high-affinity lysophosphatidic acid receptor-like [Saccostrea echinata]